MAEPVKKVEEEGEKFVGGASDFGTQVWNTGVGAPGTIAKFGFDTAKEVYEPVADASRVTSGGLVDLPTTQSEKAKAEKKAAGLANEAVEMAAAEERKRLKSIEVRLQEEIRLRQKSPGKSQTLLTPAYAPNSQTTGTLLTTGAKK
jgi:hypothetical protein